MGEDVRRCPGCGEPMKHLKRFVEISRGVYRDPDMWHIESSTGEWKKGYATPTDSKKESSKNAYCNEM